MITSQQINSFLTLVASLCVLLLAAPLQAGMVLRLTDGTTTVQVSDTDGDGRVSYNGGIGNFNVVFSIGVASNDNHSAKLHSQNFSLTTISGGTLTIDLTKDGYSILPGANNTAIFATSMSGTLSGSATVTYQGFFETDGDEFAGLNGGSGFDQSNLLTSTKSGLNVNLDSAVSSQFVSYSGGEFALTSRMVITLGSISQLSGSGLTTLHAPLPPSSIMALTGMPFLGIGLIGWYRRRRMDAE